MKKLTFTTWLMVLVLNQFHVVSQITKTDLILHVSPSSRLLTDSTVIIIKGAPAGAEISLEATLTDKGGQAWSSKAIFYADENGTVDTAKDASLKGTYLGIDQEGIFWSMQPATLEELEEAGEAMAFVDSPRRIPDFDSWNAHYDFFKDGVEITYQAKLGGVFAEQSPTTVSETQSVHWIRNGVTRTEIKEGEIRGILYEASGPGPHPVVMLVTGSGGGAYENKAAVLASNGITTFALAHFNYPDRPKELKDIPLEYFNEAMTWLSKKFSRNRVAIFGDSRGGEGVLLIASIFPDKVSGVVAGVPSNMTWGSFYPDAAWTLNDNPIPYIPWKVELRESDIHKNSSEARDIYLNGMIKYDFDDPRWIQVERIKSPILLVSGDADAVWPSNIGADKVVQRLKAKGYGYPVEHIEYKGAGHQVTYPMLVKGRLTQMESVNGFSLTMGGNPKDNAYAQTDSFEKILRFLKSHGVEGAKKY